MTTTTALTLTEALTLPQEHWVDVLADDLHLPPTTWAAVADAWVWLLGCTDPEEITAARSEVFSDGELTIALCSPMTAFMNWFRRSEWQWFASGAEADSDAWAWELIDRVRGEISRMGPLSQEISLASLMARSSLEREDIGQMTDINTIIDAFKKSGN